MFLDKIVDIFKNRELRRKLLFVLMIFVIFRLAASIPIPGVNHAQLEKLFSGSQLLGFLNVLTGGTLSNFSIVLLGIGPYITSVIILQLSTMIFPKLERLYKEEGPEGRRKFNQYGRMLTVPLAAIQGYGMLALLQSQNIIGSLGTVGLISYLTTVIAGAVFLMWLGELINEKGIGNGISLLIFAGIVARLPSALMQTISTWDPQKAPLYLAFLVIALAMIALVVLVNESRRNIPVSYAKQIRGRKVYGGTSSYLPINVNPAGVLPVIFASAFLMFPQVLTQLLAQGGGFFATLNQKVAWFLGNPWLYGSAFFLLVVAFTFFYTMITFDPEQISSNLQSSGGFIPGVRPGQPTSEYLNYVLNRILTIGAIFLGFIAVMPSIVQGITKIQSFSFLIGGTALIIMVSVVLDTYRKIKAQQEMRQYENI